jgi:hypothetical protein
MKHIGFKHQTSVNKIAIIKGGALLTIGYAIFGNVSHTPLLIAKYFSPEV